MADPNQQTPKAPIPIHPVYRVSNIQHKIRVLDGKKVTYSNWVKLFKLHARSYRVTQHIDGAAPPAKTDPTYESWREIDSHVFQWIYGTISDDILVRIMENESTAYEAWLRLKDIFTNNKGARTAALEQEFNNLKLESMASVDEYCQRLRNLATQLNDVDVSVDDKRLVLQLVRGLNGDFDTAASFIHQTMPNFATAQSMLQLELYRKNDRVEPPQSAAVLVAPSQPSDSSSDAPPPSLPTRTTRPNRRNNNRAGGRFKGRGDSDFNRQRRGEFSSVSQQFRQPPMAPWPTQPCPYPHLPRWTYNAQP